MSAGTRPVIWFSDPASSNVRQLGGNNASLGETTHNLSRTGIPCPRASRDRQRCGVVIDFCRKRSAWRADRRFVGAVRRRSGGLSLFDHLLSIMIASQISSMPQPVFILLSLLSGSTTPLGSMPDTLQRIMQFWPSTHFVSFAGAIHYRGAGAA